MEICDEEPQEAKIRSGFVCIALRSSNAPGEEPYRTRESSAMRGFALTVCSPPLTQKLYTWVRYTADDRPPQVPNIWVATQPGAEKPTEHISHATI